VPSRDRPDQNKVRRAANESAEAPANYRSSLQETWHVAQLIASSLAHHIAKGMHTLEKDTLALHWHLHCPAIEAVRCQAAERSWRTRYSSSVQVHWSAQLRAKEEQKFPGLKQRGNV